MKLTQIDLRLPFKHKYLKEFSPESWSIPELYWSHLREYSTGKIQKINILLSNNWDNELETPIKVAGFEESHLVFDFDTYFTLSKEDRKRMQLEAVHKGMMQIAEKEGWEIDPLWDAYNKCLDKNLKYQFDVGKPKTSPNRKYKIGFWCNCDIDVFELYWVLYDKSNKEIKRQKFLEKPPYEGEFIYYAKWKWLDNSKVLLEDKYKYGKNENWQIDRSEKSNRPIWGNRNVGNTSILGYRQSTSFKDMQHAGSSIRYSFEMGNNTVYKYNNQE